jgi:hypothetical protein
MKSMSYIQKILTIKTQFTTSVRNSNVVATLKKKTELPLEKVYYKVMIELSNKLLNNCRKIWREEVLFVHKNRESRESRRMLGLTIKTNKKRKSTKIATKRDWILSRNLVPNAWAKITTKSPPIMTMTTTFKE